MAETEPSRRDFLVGAAAAGAGAAWAGSQAAEEPPMPTLPGTDLPLVDFHVHLDNLGLEKALAISRRRGVRFGIVEHAGTKENQYPVVLSSDEELKRYLAMLDGQPVFRGVQAEYSDWHAPFSKDALARLDYVLIDAMTFPGTDGTRVKLWERDAPQRVDMADRQAFMDRYVDWYVALITQGPVDILANASWLPAPLAAELDAFWTAARVRKVVEAAVKHGVAIEISSSLKLPRLPFLKLAKEAGVRFSFGSNIRGEGVGTLDYSVATAKELGLKREDLFLPAPPGKKRVQIETPSRGD
jgi:histidinol phosphatase-like PHP family hydrolase